MNSVLALKRVTRVYESAGMPLEVLRGAELSIEPGQVVALVGPSGSGKTTLLQITGLLDTPTGGEVFIGGQNLTGASDAERTQARKSSIGFVYQFHHLLPDFSALENIMLPQMIAGATPATAKARALEMLSAMRLEARAGHRPAKLSGGEQQRVAIARALATRPKLLLADEPTGNLDPATAQDVFAYLMHMAKTSGVAALIATHNMELASRMDRVVVLSGGLLQERRG